MRGSYSDRHSPPGRTNGTTASRICSPVRGACRHSYRGSSRYRAHTGTGGRRRSMGAPTSEHICANRSATASATHCSDRGRGRRAGPASGDIGFRDSPAPRPRALSANRSTGRRELSLESREPRGLGRGSRARAWRHRRDGRVGPGADPLLYERRQPTIVAAMLCGPIGWCSRRYICVLTGLARRCRCRGSRGAIHLRARLSTRTADVTFRRPDTKRGGCALMRPHTRREPAVRHVTDDLSSRQGCASCGPVSARAKQPSPAAMLHSPTPSEDFHGKTPGRE